MKSKIGESKWLFLCNNYSSHDKLIHFEWCFQNLITTECNNKFSTTCSADGKEIAIFVCGKKCDNVYDKALKNKVKKDTPLTATTYWSKDGSEELLVRWLSDQIMNCDKYLGATDISNKYNSFGKEYGLLITGGCNQIFVAKIKEELGIERGPNVIKSKNLWPDCKIYNCYRFKKSFNVVCHIILDVL